MIRSRDEFESTLERAMAYLEDPPAPGAPEEAPFLRLLEELRSYAPAAEAGDGDAADPEAAGRLRDLKARLAEIDAREAPPGRFSGFRLGGDLDGV